MIRVLGGPKRLCDGLTRRDLLHVGSLGMLGLGVSGTGLLVPLPAVASSSTSGLPGFGQAKACILLLMYGSPSQIETFDPTPNAPVEVRGELGCIESSVPGLNVCELPNLAQVMDKVTLIRSLSQYPIHGVAYATTSNPVVPLAAELSPRDPSHWPFIGSVVDYVDATRQDPDRHRGGRPEVPRNLLLPWAFSSQRIGEVPRAGPYGGFLGQAYDPIGTEFVGRGTKKASKTLLQMTWNNLEPYRGIAPQSRFHLGSVSGSGGPA